MSYYSPYEPTTQFNGRVNISKPSSLQIPAYQKQKIDNSAFYAEAVQGNFTPNELSNLFFSCNNIDVLQDGLRYKIYKESGNKYIIGRQSDQDLKIIMRSIYLQYGKNLNKNIIEQVKELNAKVLEWAVPEVLSNVKQYDKYRYEVSTLPVPLERAPLETKKGTKVLEIKSFVWVNGKRTYARRKKTIRYETHQSVQRYYYCRYYLWRYTVYAVLSRYSIR